MKGILYYHKSNPDTPMVRILSDEDKISEISYEMENSNLFTFLPRILCSCCINETIGKIKNLKYEAVQKGEKIDEEKLKEYINEVDNLLRIF